MRLVKVLVASILLVFVASTVPADAGPIAYIGLYTDADHDYYCYDPPDLYSTFEVWVWVLPGDNGMICAEYELDIPPHILNIGTTPNPDLSVHLGFPVGPGGVSACFSECQSDWAWTFHHTMIGMALEPGYIEITEHPDAGAYQIASCLPDYPLEPVYILSQFGYAIGDTYPGVEITEVVPISYTTFDVKLNYNVYSHAPSGVTVYRGGTEPVEVASFYQGAAVVHVTLTEDMVDGESYTVQVFDYCHEYYGGYCDWGFRIECGDPSAEFIFDPSVATLLQGFDISASRSSIDLAWQLSSIDDGIAFRIFRREKGGEYELLPSGRIESDGLSFSYVDESVEAGKSYNYRVEYIDGATARVLFLTEEVLVPAAILSLEQNRPNPFNPSTRISYYLPVQADVSLDIFDVTGRKIRSLASGIENSGIHQVEWNGLDDSGSRVVSGVYFYRLRAGKEELTKKMVLMR